MHDFLCLLLRHGQTDRSESPTYRGQSNEVVDHLNENGKRTIRESAAFVSHLPLDITYVISSDLFRTEESAEIICDILGLDTFRMDERLRPLNVGDFAGKNKEEYPIDEYLENPSKKFPNGESVDDFENRQYDFAKSVFQWIESGKLKAGSILIVCHDDVIGYWLNSQRKNPSNRYLTEKPDVVKEGGVVLVTSGEIFPIHGRNNKTDSPWDGTALSGFVTPLESRPPRSCWNCEYFSRDLIGTGQCGNSLVRLDPEIADWRRQVDGHVIVEDEACCNLFANHAST